MARTVQVLSSDGQNHYAVQINDKGEAGPCCCKAAQNERKCWHLGEAERLHQEQEARDRKRRDPA
jgi:hypothetical protein